MPGVYALMRIPPTAVDYFVHPTLYDTTNMLRDLGTRPPRLDEYAETLSGSSGVRSLNSLSLYRG